MSRIKATESAPFNPAILITVSHDRGKGFRIPLNKIADAYTTMVLDNKRIRMRRGVNFHGILNKWAPMLAPRIKNRILFVKSPRKSQNLLKYESLSSS